MELEGKVSIVTGGAKGIGGSVVEALFQEGSNVVIWDSDTDSARLLKERLLKERLTQSNKKHNEIVIKKVDVTSSDEIGVAAEEITGKLGSIDILVNSAGLYSICPITEESESNWDRVVAVDLKGAFLCIREVVPIMTRNRYGKIVNISSISGKKESIFASPSYCAAKAGLIGLTRCVAAQTAKYGINVNCVAPGIANTTMISILDEAAREKAVRTIPLGRMCEPEDVANIVLFLVKDSSGYITGETINVNGGGFME